MKFGKKDAMKKKTKPEVKAAPAKNSADPHFADKSTSPEPRQSAKPSRNEALK